MSKFIELKTVKGSDVLINIDNILAITRTFDGNCIITLAARSGEAHYYYEVEGYYKIRGKIVLEGALI